MREVETSRQIEVGQLPKIFVTLLDRFSEAGLADKDLLIWLGLLKPENGLLEADLLQPELIGSSMELLFAEGKYSPEFINVLRSQTLLKVDNEKDRVKKRKLFIRSAKILSYVGQIAWSFWKSKSEWTVSDLPWQSMVVTGVVWHLIDEAGADADMRRLGYTVLVEEAIKRAFVEPEKRRRLEPKLLAEMTLGESNVSKEHLEVVSRLQEAVGGLMDLGVSRHRLGILFRHRWEWPSALTLGKVRERKSEKYWDKLRGLSEKMMGSLKEESREWQEFIRSRETRNISEARAIRQRIIGEVIGEVGAFNILELISGYGSRVE